MNHNVNVTLYRKPASFDILTTMGYNGEEEVFFKKINVLVKFIMKTKNKRDFFVVVDFL